MAPPRPPLLPAAAPLALLLLVLLAAAAPAPARGQQEYEANKQNNCHGSTGRSVLGYVCNVTAAAPPPCDSYLVWRPIPTYNTPVSISYLFNVSPATVSAANGVPTVSPVPASSLALVPVPCACTAGGLYQHNASRTIQLAEKTYFTIANLTYQGLTTCQALIAQNPLHDSRGLVEGNNLTVPLRCACPSPAQAAKGVKHLLSYLVTWGDSVSAIADRFRVDAQDVLDANSLAADDIIYPFTTLLVPLKAAPTPDMLASPAPPPAPTPLQSTPTPDMLDSHGHGKRTKLYIFASTSSFLLMCLIILAFFLTYKYGLLPFKSKDKPRIESFLQKNGNLHPKRYTYADVKRMTKSFSAKLGQGGFGAVYLGNLSDGCQVAVKMLKDINGGGEEFMNEVVSISRTSHVNVVTLLGFCLQGSKRALIYEYMPNGSLEKYTFGSNINNENILSWEKLFDIAIGIARGLEYLHRGCNTRIVHFDIKPHNILLDQDFCPKISDFGLAKLCLNKESVISIVGARGTIGYIAPEVYSKLFGTVSSKSDVYSYGMMVLEMVGARDMNISADSESSSQYFPQWIYEHVDEYCISASEINGETAQLVRKMIVVGLWCIQVIPTNRPTMTRVVEMLEGSTSNLELPPKVLLI